MGKKPNILFLMSDEHRADVTGYEGNSVIRTANLDWLAQTGAVLLNAYTPSPICIPGRQSLMAGQFPRHTGCEVFGADLQPGHMTFARRFAQYGYSTVACGKLHHYGSDQMQGWTQRIGDDTEVGLPFIEGRNEEECRRTLRPMSDMKWTQEKEIKRAGIGRAPHIVKDEYTVQGALDFIDNYFLNPYYDRETPNKPLLLKVSLLQPHYPYTADEDKFRYYLNRVEPFQQQQVTDHPFLSRFQVQPGTDASEREIRRAVAAYYAMIETVDDHFGTVLWALEQAGQNLDEWIIVYTSDHGEMLGEHGVWEKQKFFEGSARVPLLIRWPQHIEGGHKVMENVNLCDLFATLCDMANIPVPPDLDSRSLVPLLTGASSNWDNESVSQFGGTHIMIKQDHLKYQYYGTEMPEVLFDLNHNPEETLNFIDHPDYAEQLERFRMRRKELGFH
ncbi:sulfatase-like hydrolase/transferase [Paenibacillus sp. FSL H8-0034]|uniref:sulfatase-like hydrolase/transferase n=1 Tax=Paenibacillus sp. FSL H8-0034 TaxID=2954671 RepID=UPI0030FA0AB4